ncbi:MAG: MATE family efflux transporter [Bacteroidales bacterium]|jgi:putative MATE family efflux protein|nr:MATE family efflux transporter [Bacteroidales bacterium]
MRQGVPTYGKIWQVSYPIILSLLAQNIINVIDTAFLGRVGEVELGASAIAGLFYIAVFMLGFGFSIGTQIMIARRNGEKKFKQIGSIFDQSSYFFLLLGLIIFVFIYFFGASILKQIVSSDNIFLASEAYLNIRVWGIFFAFGNLAFRSLFVGVTQTKALGYSAVIMAVTNIVFDYLLIFGHYGFPQMGIAGAALASLISEAVSFIFFIFYARLKLDEKKYQLFRFLKIDFSIIKSTLSISSYIMIQYFLSIATWFSFFAIIEQMGERPLAVSNIVRSIYMVLVIPIMGLSTATTSLVSNAIGEGFTDDVMSIINRIVKISLFSVIPFILLIWLIPEYLIRVYTNDPNLIADSIASLYVISGAILIFAVAFIVFSGVSGTANTKTALGIEIITLVFYLAFLYWVVILRNVDVAVAWTSEYIYMSSLTILSYWYLIKGNWRLKKI